MNKKLLRDSALFSFSRYVLMGMSFIRNFVVARVLDPENYGYWVIVTIVLAYGDQIHLGLRHAGDKEIPYLQGQGRSDESQRTANTIFGGVLLLSGAALAVLGGFVLITGNTGEGLERMIFLAGLIVFMEQINRYYLMIMRVKRLFVFSMKVEIITEAFRTLLVCVLVYYFSIWGAIVGFLAGALFMMFYAIAHFKKEFVPKLDRRLLGRLFNLGFSLFGVSLVFVALINADRLFGATVLSKAELGIYGVAALAAQLPLNFTQGISSVVYSTLSETFGKSNDVAALSPISLSVLSSLSFAIPLIAGTTYFGSTFLISLFLPVYMGSLKILAILLPGVFFLAFVPFLSGLFTVANRARQFLVLELFVAVCSVLLFVGLQKFSPGPEGVGIAMTAGMLLYAATAIVAAFRLFSIGPVETVRRIAGIYWPSLYCMIVVGVILNTIGNEADPMSALIGYAMFLLASIPLVIVASRVLDLRKMFNVLRSSHG